MVTDGVSLRRIKSYLRRWCVWWVKSSQSLQYEEVEGWFIQIYWDTTVKNIAATILRPTITDVVIIK